MHPFDKIFRDKFHRDAESADAVEKRHPFDESYWLAAEKLLVKEQRRRKFFWWFNGIGLISAILLIGYYTKNKESQNIDNQQITQFSQFSKQEQYTAIPTDLSSHDAAATAAKVPISNPLAVDTIDQNSSAALVKGIREVVGSAVEKTTPDNQPFEDFTREKISTTTTDQFPEETLSPSNSATGKALYKLPCNLYLLSNPTNLIAPQHHENILFSKKKGTPKWRYGLQAGYFLSPHGWTAGIFIDKKWNEKWRITAAPRLKIRNDVGLLEKSSVTQFDFGYHTQENTLQRQRNYWVEMPLSLQYNLEKIAVEGGISPAFLIGNRGRFETFQRSTFNESLQKNSSQKVWLDDDNYQKYSATIFAGIKIQTHRNFALQMRGTFLTQNLEKNSSVTGLSVPRWGAEANILYLIK